MNQEEKNLLFKDLCARLPYVVKVQFKTNGVIENKYKFIYNVDGEYEYINIGKSNLTLDIIKMLTNNCIDEIKPYLFPLSSMTEEEWEDYQKIRMMDWVHGDINGTFINAGLIVDWLNAHHFDYRGLIEKGLAIDATNLNIY